nr:MAG TPA: hypothetical protein [Caudoviricetes sp.]
MKEFRITFWRGNPQLSNGGYEATRIVEARTLSSAKKQADKICSSCVYGGMSVKK